MSPTSDSVRAAPTPAPHGVGCVLMTADTVGGVWTYALELARALGGAGVRRVVLATMGEPLSHDQWEEARALPCLTVEEGRFQLEWMDEPWEDVARAGDWLLALERRHAPDVVHLNGYAHGALPFRAPHLVVGHSCVLSWWEAVKGEPAPERCARYHAAVRAGLHAAPVVLAPSRAMLHALERHYGPLPGRRGVIPNARRPEDFPPAPAKEPFVLTAGRLWDEAKNVAAVDRAARHLPWAVYVAGETRHPGSGPDAAHAHARPLGRLSPRALAGWMGRASVYALPARYEPFGLSALEAALAGCALVLGDVPSLREVWGEAARFVPPDAPDVLAHALAGLAASPDERARLAARARARALDFAPRTQAARYLDAYASLAAAHDVPRTWSAAPP